MVEENRTVYVFVDKDGVVDGYSLTKEDGAFEISLDNKDFYDSFNFYRYSDGKLVYDYELEVESTRKNRATKITNQAQELITGAFAVKDFLIPSYTLEFQMDMKNTKELFEYGMIDEITLDIIKDNKPERLIVNASSFNFIFMSGVIHKNKITGLLKDKYLPAIKEASTIEEINEIVWSI